MTVPPGGRGANGTTTSGFVGHNSGVVPSATRTIRQEREDGQQQPAHHQVVTELLDVSTIKLDKPMLRDDDESSDSAVAFVEGDLGSVDETPSGKRSLAVDHEPAEARQSLGTSHEINPSTGGVKIPLTEERIQTNAEEEEIHVECWDTHDEAYGGSIYEETTMRLSRQQQERIEISTGPHDGSGNADDEGRARGNPDMSKTRPASLNGGGCLTNAGTGETFVADAVEGETSVEGTVHVMTSYDMHSPISFVQQEVSAPWIPGAEDGKDIDGVMGHVSSEYMMVVGEKIRPWTQTPDNYSNQVCGDEDPEIVVVPISPSGEGESSRQAHQHSLSRHLQRQVLTPCEPAAGEENERDDIMEDVLSKHMVSDAKTPPWMAPVTHSEQLSDDEDTEHVVVPTSTSGEGESSTQGQKHSQIRQFQQQVMLPFEPADDDENDGDDTVGDVSSEHMVVGAKTRLWTSTATYSKQLSDDEDTEHVAVPMITTGEGGSSSQGQKHSPIQKFQQQVMVPCEPAADDGDDGDDNVGDISSEHMVVGAKTRPWASTVTYSKQGDKDAKNMVPDNFRTPVRDNCHRKRRQVVPEFATKGGEGSPMGGSILVEPREPPQHLRTPPRFVLENMTFAASATAGGGGEWGPSAELENKRGHRKVHSDVPSRSRQVIHRRELSGQVVTLTPPRFRRRSRQTRHRRISSEPLSSSSAAVLSSEGSFGEESFDESTTEDDLRPSDKGDLPPAYKTGRGISTTRPAKDQMDDEAAESTTLFGMQFPLGPGAYAVGASSTSMNSMKSNVSTSTGSHKNLVGTLVKEENVERGMHHATEAEKHEGDAEMGFFPRAEEVTEDDVRREEKLFQQKRRRLNHILAIFGALLILGAVAAVAVVLLLKPPVWGKVPPPPTPPPVTARDQQILNFLLPYYSAEGYAEVLGPDVNSTQHQAVKWLAYQDEASLPVPSSSPVNMTGGSAKNDTDGLALLQRYAAAVVMLSLNFTTFTRKKTSSECSWDGMEPPEFQIHIPEASPNVNDDAFELDIIDDDDSARIAFSCNSANWVDGITVDLLDCSSGESLPQEIGLLSRLSRMSILSTVDCPISAFDFVASLDAASITELELTWSPETALSYVEDAGEEVFDGGLSSSNVGMTSGQNSQEMTRSAPVASGARFSKSAIQAKSAGRDGIASAPDLAALFPADDDEGFDDGFGVSGPFDDDTGLDDGVSSPPEEEELQEMYPEIPSAVWDLTNMVHLSIHGAFGGTLAVDALSNLSRLEVLNITSTNLRGTLADERRSWMSLSALQTLDLSDNYITGKVPNAFASLTSLTSLDISHNRLTTLPPSLWKLPTLVSLDVSFNPGLMGTVSDTVVGENIVIQETQLTCPNGKARFELSVVTGHLGVDIYWQVMDILNVNATTMTSGTVSAESNDVEHRLACLDPASCYELSFFVNDSGNAIDDVGDSFFARWKRTNLESGEVRNAVPVTFGSCDQQKEDPPNELPGGDDADSCNPTVPSPEVECLLGQKKFELTVIMDQAPKDISWEVRQLPDKSIVKSVPPGAYCSKDEMYRYRTCLDEDQCYSFLIQDAAGDGLCCQRGDGSFKISWDGEEVMSGGHFKSLLGVFGGPCREF